MRFFWTTLGYICWHRKFLRRCTCKTFWGIQVVSWTSLRTFSTARVFNHKQYRYGFWFRWELGATKLYGRKAFCCRIFNQQYFWNRYNKTTSSVFCSIYWGPRCSFRDLLCVWKRLMFSYMFLHCLRYCFVIKVCFQIIFHELEHITKRWNNLSELFVFRLFVNASKLREESEAQVLGEGHGGCSVVGQRWWSSCCWCCKAYPHTQTDVVRQPKNEAWQVTAASPQRADGERPMQIFF